MSTTKRTRDGVEVPWSEATAAWAAAARPVLERAARRYNAFLTYQDLAEAVQEDAGIVTGSAFRNWIGGVLNAVTESQRPEEPMLTSLVVRADGSIGEGYAVVVAAREGAAPADPDLHAAGERLACYRHFGAELPADGGRAHLTPLVAERRSRVRPVAIKPNVCPTCSLALPATGICDTCADCN